MKIIFLGTPEFALPSFEALLETSWIEVLALCTQTDKEAGRGQKVQEPPVKKLANEKGILVLQAEKISKDPETIKKIKDLNPDILITCAFGQILNQEVLDLAPLGVINVHASLLPAYRGAAPINWAILNGEKETGISIMRTELGLDSGPVLVQDKCEISENETSVDLTKKLSLLGPESLIKALELIRDGKANFIDQDHSKATKAPSLKKDLGLIDWSKTAIEIHNKVRALQPWPSAYTKFQGKTIKIWESRTGEPESWRVGEISKEEKFSHSPILPTSGSLECGSITDIKDFIRVRTQDGFIDIYKVQPENKKILNVKDWVNGARIKIGDKFEF